MKKKRKNSRRCYYIAGKVTGEDILKVHRKFNQAEFDVMFNYDPSYTINPTKLCKLRGLGIAVWQCACTT